MKKNIRNKGIKSVCFTLMLGILPLSMMAKDKTGVIMTVDEEEVPTEEFLYLFQKNLQQQVTPQNLDEYLQMFEVYRLKVAEAKKLGIDTVSTFKKEMANYRQELLEPYVADTVFFNKLVDIAYGRENTMVESSHIMIIRTHDDTKDQANLQMLDSLRTELLNGADFIEIAKQYSQDQFSSDKGGYLGFSSPGTYPYAFETAVYETPEGEISEIVESHVGWHLVKSGARKASLDFNKPVKTYSDVKNEVMRKVSSPFDSRYHEIRKNQIARLSEKHPEIKIEGLSDDAAYNLLIQAEEKSQYAENPEYRNLVDEYINGSLLYEASLRNIWNKATEDQVGLENFYQQNKDKYTWDRPHAKGLLVRTQNDSVMEVIKLQIADMPVDSIALYIKKNFKGEALAEKFNMAEGSNPLIDYLMFGASEPTEGYGKYGFSYVIEGRIVESPENLEDVKGAVINDYQEELEKEWVNKLKKEHSVKINKKELANIRKQIEK